MTGDVARYTVLEGQDEPAISLESDGPSQGVASVQRDETGTYVVPSAAIAAVVSGALDLELFDVAQLVADGYDDASSSNLPVLLHNESGSAAPDAKAGGGRVQHRLGSIDAVGVSVRKKDAGRFWAAYDTARERNAADVDKIWLDAKVSVDLADSVPQIGAPEAWRSGFDGAGVTVAVLDTGIDKTHPDLEGQIVAERNFTDAEGTVDGYGHGTHVASTIAGTGTGNGAKGVAPGAKLLNGRVLGANGSGTISWIIEGMQWAVAHHADVVNMSLGVPVPDDGTGPLASAVNALTASSDTLFVVSAGNSGPNTIGEPASAESALTVGAVDKSDVLAGFSSTGPRLGDYGVKPEISAPGVNIVAARAAGTSMGTPVDDKYTTASGTSMAAPHVAGAVALLAQAHPDLSAADLKATLVGSAETGDYRVETGGAGRVAVVPAIEQQVYALPDTLDLGAVRYAADGAYEPVTASATIHNDSDVEQTFALTAAVSAESGAAVPDDAVDAPTEVTVPAGGSSKVTMALDPNQLERETLYSGLITAVASDSSAALRIPLSMYVEPLMYDISLTATTPDGGPVSDSSWVTLFGDQGFRTAQATFRNGVATARVEPGVYSAITILLSPDEGGQWANELATEVRTAVDATAHDVSWTLDTAEASELAFDTGRETELQGGALSYWSHGYLVSFGPDFKHLRVFPTDASPSDTPRVAVHTALSAPVLQVGAGGLDLEPTGLDGARSFEGEATLRLVDVGDGSADGFAGKRVRGALVLATPADRSTLTDVIETAAAGGARAVALGNDSPGRLVAPVESRAVPAFALRGAEASALRERASQAGGIRERVNFSV